MITIKEFNSLPQTTKLQEILSFFKKNKDKAFTSLEVQKYCNLSKSQVYNQLLKLKQSGNIEQRGYYFALKKEITGGEE